MFSPRQEELFWLLLTPLKGKEIAHLMGDISVTTVDTIATFVYSKKGVRGRIELISQFYQEILDRHGITEKSDVTLMKLKKIQDSTRPPGRARLDQSIGVK